MSSDEMCLQIVEATLPERDVDQHRWLFPLVKTESQPTAVRAEHYLAWIAGKPHRELHFASFGIKYSHGFVTACGCDQAAVRAIG